MTATHATRSDLPRDRTGIPGLDDVLGGGLPKNRLYVVKGEPGVGKTTLALQFLLEGKRAGERLLYVTLSETKEEIRQVADSHGWSLDGIELYELASVEQVLGSENENTLYLTADVDLKETVRVLLDEVDRVRPHRVVFDSLSEIRMLAQSPMRYRRELMALKRHFVGRAGTVLLLDDKTGTASDVQVESLAHGVLLLEQVPTAYGTDRRRVRIAKLRGSPFRSGYHDYVVSTGGIVVFPRLVASEHRSELLSEPLPSGLPALDALLGGGMDRSTATLLTGPAGTGKSALATQFACTAAERGEVASLFLFEERIGTLRRRAQHLGMPLDRMMASGKVRVHQIDPAERAPDEFTAMVRDAVDRHGARVIVVDSINGYYAAMPEARFLSLQMHEMLGYLAERGVASIVTMAQTGLAGGGATATPIDLSYLADTIVVLRYYELEGHLRKAISVVKKRSGAHEETIRGFELGAAGIVVGPPLSRMRGVLTGTPWLVDAPPPSGGGTP
jgi:circadian clock protein KaiC